MAAALAAALALAPALVLMAGCVPADPNADTHPVGKGSLVQHHAQPVRLPASGAAHSAASVRIAGLELPAPGSYTLDHIMPAPHGAVLDSDGSAHRLAEFATGKITVFSFVYTTCSDARGCPLALATLHTLKAAIGADALLRDKVRLVSMSFDPDHDTPPVMRSYGGADASAASLPRWHFLTTQSVRQLSPLLDGFGQDVGMGVGDQSGPTGRAQLSHMLKIYLLDAHGDVREIYSPAFLQPATMLADIRTLARQTDAGSGTTLAAMPSFPAAP